MPAREHDIVLLGSTGYTGRLVAECILGAPEADRMRVAFAGRNRAKLERVRAALARAGREPPALLFADTDRPETLDAIARDARVVCSTAGPYAKYGSELVAACVRHGTDYCDITGETHWMRRMIAAHHDAA